jgi:hypothetical protein
MRIAYDARVSLSRSLAVALSAALGLLPVAPPEHVHEAEEQGHSHVVVHRHATTHGILEHHSDHHATSTLEDHDGPAFTLTDSYTVPATQVLVGPPAVAATLIEPTVSRRLARVFVGTEVLIHGPPRAPTGLRAPPFSPAS